jgi:catechol 2,3-dioxygenase-like lactoylglutathione lyase family enzyme
VPVLASLDFDETERFYTRHLGFSVTFRGDDYLMLHRQGCELHFWRCADRHIAENTSCYLRGPVDALHAEFTSTGLGVDSPQDRTWGMREMYVWDPHGNLLKFGESC